MRDRGTHISRVRTKTARALAKAHLRDDRVHGDIQRHAKILVTRGMPSYRFIRTHLEVEGTIWCFGPVYDGIAVIVSDDDVDTVTQYNGRIL